MNLHAGRIRNAVRFIAGSSVALSSLLCATHAFADKAHDTLVYASDSEVENVSAYQNNLREGVILAHLIWDNLIYEDPATGQFKPELATAWKWESPTSLLLDLRHDVKFQNGDPFTAADVAFTFNYMTAPDSKVITRQNVDWIKGAQKVSDYQVRIQLKAPFPAALEYLAGPLPIYPEAYFRKVGPEGFSKAPVGTGPYRVTSIQPGVGVTLVKNSNYFSGSPLGQPKIGTIRFVVIPDPETRAAQLMTGAVDWIWRVPADQAQSLKATPNLTVAGGETMRIGFLTMDDQGTSAPNSPFRDVRVRQAVNYAVNRAALANDLVRGGSQPIYAPCFHTQFGCDASVALRYGYDPAKARELLKEAGYPNGFETDLYAYRERDYAEAIIGDLRKVGIVAHLHYLQYAALRTAYRAGKTPMTFQAWGSYSVNDASASLGAFFKGGPDDTAKDPAVMKDIGIADASNDPTERKAHYAAALKRISEQAYWAPLFSYSTNYAFTSDLNFQPWPDELPRFYQASWK
ncbi:ABC transporter substrate-binding protein [Paraburkholderia silvatlantica]|uniref:Peptide/nickel transport system substrate-binding protein n=2 Tax=cellular organisms TaxID=131567 RepID=A0A2U1A9G7_9BURK|nr:ABC transporter substrate-binding protein [Paraburkholderia silvatlantica]MBB2930504.1 peptide/nickel transport system substrate-binding protein [Paraburkholderia silvatlantica]PVY30311.1 peptide/nickel transport system substrate-binding protein [Paraburkholderia silvatlantica]PXW36953.1 peptide/nickel transport system substrate-binding protein [Paraburkholderia silvatlantica]PYE21292.1 peptide/nickel transport system substrate-binding protein [Paraburkholderia silvatlantica]TDQ86567.1 pept